MVAETQVFLAAMTPLGELRVALPLAIVVHQLNWPSAFLLSVFGNLLSVFLLLLFLKSFSGFLSKKIKIYRNLFEWFFTRIQKKYHYSLKKYGYPVLVAFTAIPLPMTGGWTAALISFIFGIPFKKALPLIALGVIIAGLIVSFITYSGIALEKYFGWQIIITIFLILVLVWLIRIKNKYYEKK